MTHTVVIGADFEGLITSHHKTHFLRHLVGQNTNITSSALLPFVSGRLEPEEFGTPVREDIGQDRVNEEKS